ncbi:hypothetical protein HPB49_007254 [Dermacentor silvarum]|uniref:Uncharacterized protein n=1 Tax=Dermacentor silvarum TaxID=543639 RepID=A0ACB8DWJ8_DERSI|nr:hypothetical protein HPB49_007254 [Dermacentor silvarum]
MTHQFSRTNDNSDNHPARRATRSRVPRSVRARYRDTLTRSLEIVANENRGSPSYVLQGFDCYFLNSRSVTFAEPLPSVRVCASCSVVPARAVQLPCGHTLCELCENDAFDRAAAAAQCDQDDSAVAMHHGAVCPHDGTPFAEAQLKVLTFSLEQLHQHVAFCVNSCFGCAFQAQLRRLEEHCFTECRVRRRICRHCGQVNILACDTRLHSMRCFQW